MPRTRRDAPGGFVYHVLNRGNRKRRLFDAPADYDAFEAILHRTVREQGMRLLAYEAMPNHWHLVLWPQRDGELSRFMHVLSTRHAVALHTSKGTGGLGHVYQGRFRCFPVQEDVHLLLLCRYVERNALRAGLVQRAEHWPWSSLWLRVHLPEVADQLLTAWPVEPPDDWVSFVNDPRSESELRSLQACARRSRPWGAEAWRGSVARRFAPGRSNRPRGRPPIAM